MSEEKFLTVEELAQFLKVPNSWIYSRTQENGPDAIPRVKVGKYLRFRPDDVLSWIEEKQHAEE